MDREPSFIELIKSEVRFTLLTKALQITHLDTILNNGNQYSVFAPNDSAMIQVGLTDSALDTFSIDSLTSILKYHILRIPVLSTELTQFKENQYFTLNDDNLSYFEINNFGIFINGIPVIHPDLKVNNGVVHEISEVLFPPKGTVAETMATLPDISYFYQGYFKGEDFLSSITRFVPPFTYLAVDNSAFEKLGIDNLITLENEQIDPNSFFYKVNFSKVSLNSYIDFNGQFFTSDFMGSYSFGSLSFGPFNPSNRANQAYILKGGVTGYGLINSSNFAIIKKNIVCKDGVIHIINNFL